MLTRPHSKSASIFDMVLLFLLFILSFGYFLYGYQDFDLGRYHYDEAISIYGATRVLDGCIPYRDFWTLYAPGQFYTIAAIFKIFGISTQVARLFAITVLCLTVCGVFLLIKKFCLKIFAILAFLLSLFWLKYYLVYNRPGQLAMLFFISCCFPIISFIKSGSRKSLACAGALIGIIYFFRQDFGFYILAACSLVVFLRQMNHSETYLRDKVKSALKTKAFLFLGFFTVFLPLIMYFIAKSSFKEFTKDTIIFPVIIYPKVRDLPFPELKLDTLVFYFPVLIFLITCIRLLFFNWKDKITSDFPWFIMFLLFSGLGLFHYSNTRVHTGQFLPTTILAIILFILLLNDFLSKKLIIIRLLGNIFLASLFVVLHIYFCKSMKSTSAKLKYLSDNQDKSRLDVSRAYGFYDGSELAQSQIQAIKFIQSRTTKDEKIFVGNVRHDRVVNSDVMFYFLSERDSATKYYELHPGVTTTRETQAEIIDELNKAKVRYIILWSGSDDVKEPNESAKSSEVKDLDDFIQKNYKIEEIFGYYKIFKHT